jgi:hypothetical protein
VYLHEHAEADTESGTATGSGSGGAQINKYAGHLLRVKAAGVEEGGVASGFSCLSSPALC